MTREAVGQGFNHFKMKVGADQANDLRRAKIIRSIIDDPQYLPPYLPLRDPNSEALRGKNAGPTGSVLMIDANQVWDVKQAIDYVTGLREVKPWYDTHFWIFLDEFTRNAGSLKSQQPRMTFLATLPYARH